MADRRCNLITAKSMSVVEKYLIIILVIVTGLLLVQAVVFIGFYFLAKRIV